MNTVRRLIGYLTDKNALAGKQPKIPSRLCQVIPVFEVLPTPLKRITANIFAVQVLAGRRYPDVINDDRARIADSFVLPDEPLDAVPADYVKRAF